MANHYDEDAQYYQEHRDDPEEWGEAVDATTQKARLEAMLSVRLTAEEADLVRRAASDAGQSVSDFMRAAILQQARRAPSIQLQRGDDLAARGGDTSEGSTATVTGPVPVAKP